MAEIAGVAGLDWFLLDMEHGSGLWKMLAYQLMAFSGTLTAPIFRLPSLDSVYFKRALDLGAWGPMLPIVNKPEEARNALDYSRYPPNGTRGVSSVIRGVHYGANFEEQPDTDHLSTLQIAQVESSMALDNIEEIAGVDGIEALFVGPGDLSVSMGITIQSDHPDFFKAIDKTIGVASDNRIASGILGFTESDLQSYYKMGLNLVAVGSDGGMVAKGFKSLVAASLEFRQ